MSSTDSRFEGSRAPVVHGSGEGDRDSGRSAREPSYAEGECLVQAAPEEGEPVLLFHPELLRQSAVASAPSSGQ